ncbi:MAG: 6,7-dimethyl-8-ribityllumazine synthase, partial [Dissulfurimicrobium hydrothermale]
MSVKTYEGHLDASGMHIGIVVARFNEFISSKLLSGAVDALVRHGAREDDIEIAWVPGAFEIPLAAKMFAASGRCDGV